MLTSIRIQGLGPHLDFEAALDADGTTWVRGPSEAGKSFLIEAVCFVLWGALSGGRFRPEAIHDGQKKAVVELTMASGRIVSRSISRSRSQSRWITDGSEVSTFKKEDDFAAALGALGTDAEAVRLVVVPLAWQGLIGTNGRKLRDVLARILPEGDAAAQVEALMAEAGAALKPGEGALDESGAGALRRDARKRRDEAAGRVQEATATIERLDGEAPAELPVVEPAVTERIAAWDTYERQAGAASARVDALAAQRDWDARRAALGEAPPTDPTHAAAPVRLQLALQNARAAETVLADVTGRFQLVSTQLSTFGAGTDTCPMCKRPGWQQGADFVAQLVTQQEGIQGEFGGAQARHQAAQSELAAAQQLSEAARAAASELAAWQAAERALGPRPQVPEAPAGELAPPPGERPTADEREQARQAATAIATADALRVRRERELEGARKALASANEAHVAAEAEAVRTDALLEAVRRAPSIVAAKQALALGDLGPVTLAFGDNPAVEVLIDGRPWWLASRGRQVVADLWLRAGLRRAMAMPELPIFVDNVQDVGGQPLPDIPGPVVLLETTDGEGLHVGG